MKLNKEVLNYKLEPGKFSSTPNNILYDENLTSNAKVILISILNDSKDWCITHKLFMNRFKLGEKAVRNAFNNLEDNGYIKTDPLEHGQYYTVSPFGTLKGKKKDTPKPEPVDKKVSGDEYEKLGEEYLMKICTLYNDHQDIKTKFDEIDLDNIKTRKFDFKRLKREVDEFITNKKKALYKQAMAFSEAKENQTNYSKKAYNKYLKDVKEQIFDRSNFNVKYKTMWITIKSSLKGVDQETAQYND